MNNVIDDRMNTTTEETTILSKECGISTNIKQFNFAVALPQSVGHETKLPDPILQMMGDAGIVGSVLILKNAAMIWLGWGHIDSSGGSTTVEGRGIPTMGAMVVGFPRTQYKGLGDGEASCSQLVGGDSEDQMLGWQMAARLSRQLGYPIFVSCSLFESETHEWMAGLDKASVAQLAAALAERKVRGLLKEQNIVMK